MYNQNEKVEPIDVAEEISRSFLDYSMSVIISRALPDARDGLKPSQRRILFAMSELGVMPTRKHLKCAKIVGETMGNYHPHGDQAIYPTLVHMAQTWAMRETLIEGQGNFGSVEGDPPASMRYTEARLRPLGAILMEDMDHEMCIRDSRSSAAQCNNCRRLRIGYSAAGQFKQRRVTQACILHVRERGAGQNRLALRAAASYFDNRLVGKAGEPHRFQFAGGQS